jgi:hypothetical protein
MLQVIEKGKGGSISYRVTTGTVIDEITATVYDPSGNVLIATADLDDCWQSAVSADVESGEYRVLTCSDVVAELKGRRVRCIPTIGPEIDCVVEGADETTDTVTVRLPRRTATIAAVIDPVIQVTIPATVDVVGDAYRVDWTWEADDVAGHDRTLFAVAYRATPLMSWNDVIVREPGFRLWQSGSGEFDQRATLDAAVEEVETQMAHFGQRLMCIAERDQLAALVVDAVRMQAARSGIMPVEYAKSDPAGYLARVERAFVARCEAVLRGAYRQADQVATGGPILAVPVLRCRR